MRSRITPRRKQLILLRAAGCTNGEIAAQLGITQRTVESYFQRILDTLNAQTAPQVVTRALLRGVITIDELRAVDEQGG